MAPLKTVKFDRELLVLQEIKSRTFMVDYQYLQLTHLNTFFSVMYIIKYFWCIQDANCFFCEGFYDDVELQQLADYLKIKHKFSQ